MGNGDTEVPHGMHILWRGDWSQRLRLVSGLVLFTFATTHFLNHALGLFDLQTMYEVQQWRWLVTRSTLGTIVLGTALATHVVLALEKLMHRATLRMPAWELVQLLLGLSIPFLLFPHIVNTRVARSLFGVNDTYLYELARLWPDGALLQSTLLVIVWIHGCIGIHFWLRLYAPYRRFQTLLLLVAMLIPIAALLGFMVGGRAVAHMTANTETFSEIKRLSNWPSAANADTLATYRFMVKVAFAAMLATALAIFMWPAVRTRFFPQFKVTYTDGPVVSCARGPTLLEISRLNGVPHASICGGRARCSTCRVRIEDGGDSLPAPAFPEIVTLGSIKAPQRVRLACQIRPVADLTVTRMLKAASTTAMDVNVTDFGDGVEKSLAVMVLDLRDFTRLSQSKLPHDIVFLLNELFSAAGSAITRHDGWIDKFMGDGLLAVFGEKGGIEMGCRQALRAARAIDIALDNVNAKLESEVGRPLRIGIGIEAGPLLMGRIGFGPSVDVTVIGNTVNVASRLEGLAKDRGVQIVVSRAAAVMAGWDPPPEIVSAEKIAGLKDPLQIVSVLRGRDLPTSILTPEDAAAAVIL